MTVSLSSQQLWYRASGGPTYRGDRVTAADIQELHRGLRAPGETWWERVSSRMTPEAAAYIQEQHPRMHMAASGGLVPQEPRAYQREREMYWGSLQGAFTGFEGDPWTASPGGWSPKSEPGSTEYGEMLSGFTEWGYSVDQLTDVLAGGGGAGLAAGPASKFLEQYFAAEYGGMPAAGYSPLQWRYMQEHRRVRARGEMPLPADMGPEEWPEGYFTRQGAHTLFPVSAITEGGFWLPGEEPGTVRTPIPSEKIAKRVQQLGAYGQEMVDIYGTSGESMMTKAAMLAGPLSQARERGATLRAFIPYEEVLPSGMGLLSKGAIGTARQDFFKDIALPTGYEPTGVPEAGTVWQRAELEAAGGITPFTGAATIPTGDWDWVELTGVTRTETGMRLSLQHGITPERAALSVKFAGHKVMTPVASGLAVPGRPDIQAVLPIKDPLGVAYESMMAQQPDVLKGMLGLGAEEELPAWQAAGAQLTEQFRQTLPEHSTTLQIGGREVTGFLGDVFAPMRRDYPTRRPFLSARELDTLQRTSQDMYQQIMQEARPLRESYWGIINAALTTSGDVQPSATAARPEQLEVAQIVASARVKAMEIAGTTDFNQVPPGIMARQVIESAAEVYGGTQLLVPGGALPGPAHVRTFLASRTFESEEATALGWKYAGALVAMTGEQDPTAALQGAFRAVGALAGGTDPAGETTFLRKAAGAFLGRATGPVVAGAEGLGIALQAPVKDVLRGYGLEPGTQTARQFEKLWLAGKISPRAMYTSYPTPGEEPFQFGLPVLHPDVASRRIAEAGGVPLDPQTPVVTGISTAQMMMDDFDGDRAMLEFTGTVTGQGGTMRITNYAVPEADPAAVEKLGERAISWGAGALGAEFGQGPGTVEGMQAALDPSTWYTYTPGQIQEKLAADLALRKKIGPTFNVLEDVMRAAKIEGGPAHTAAQKLFYAGYAKTQRPQELPEELGGGVVNLLQSYMLRSGWFAGADPRSLSMRPKGFEGMIQELMPHLAGATEFTPEELATLITTPEKREAFAGILGEIREEGLTAERAERFRGALGTPEELISTPLGSVLGARAYRRELMRAKREGGEFELRASLAGPLTPEMEAEQAARDALSKRAATPLATRVAGLRATYGAVVEGVAATPVQEEQGFVAGLPVEEYERLVAGTGGGRAVRGEGGEELGWLGAGRGGYQGRAAAPPPPAAGPPPAGGGPDYPKWFAQMFGAEGEEGYLSVQVQGGTRQVHGRWGEAKEPTKEGLAEFQKNIRLLNERLPEFANALRPAIDGAKDFTPAMARMVKTIEGLQQGVEGGMGVSWGTMPGAQGALTTAGQLRGGGAWDMPAEARAGMEQQAWTTALQEAGGGGGGGGGWLGQFAPSGRGIFGGGGLGQMAWGLFNMQRLWRYTGGQVTKAMGEYVGYQAQQQQAMAGLGIGEGYGGAVTDIMGGQAAMERMKLGFGRAGWETWGWIPKTISQVDATMEPGIAQRGAALGLPLLGAPVAATMAGGIAKGLGLPAMAGAFGLAGQALGVAALGVGAAWAGGEIAAPLSREIYGEEEGYQTWQQAVGGALRTSQAPTAFAAAGIGKGFQALGWQAGAEGMGKYAAWIQRGGLAGGLLEAFEGGAEEEPVSPQVEAFQGASAQLQSELNLAPAAADQALAMYGQTTGRTPGMEDWGPADIQAAGKLSRYSGGLQQRISQGAQRIAMAGGIEMGAPEMAGFQEWYAGLGPTERWEREAVGQMVYPAQMQMYAATGEFMPVDIQDMGIQEARMVQRRSQGDRGAWTQRGRELGREELITVDEETGMAIGADWGGGILARGIESGRLPVSQLAQEAFRTANITVQADNATVQIGGFDAPLTQEGLQDISTQMRREQQGWQFGQQREQLAARYAYTTGMAMPGQEGGEQFMGRGMWQMQDQATMLQYGYQQQQFGFQEEQLGLSNQQFYDRWNVAQERQGVQIGWGRQDLDTQWGRQQTRFGWAAEDLAFKGAQSTLQYGWGQEDIQESMRYATGRERRQLMKRQERMTITYGMGMGQLDEEGNRLDQRRRWAEEDHNKARRRFDQRAQWARRDLDMQRRHHEQNQGLAQRRLQASQKYYEENFELQEKMKEASREYWTYNIETQLEALVKSEELWENLNKVQDLLTGVTQSQQKALSWFGAQFTSGGLVREAWQGFAGEMYSSIQGFSAALAGYDGAVQNNPYDHTQYPH